MNYLYGILGFTVVSGTIYKLTRPIELNQEQLQAIHLENEKFSKLLEIMQDLNKNGLKKAAYSHLDESEAETFINASLLYHFSQSTSYFYKDTVLTFTKAAKDILETEHDIKIEHNVKHYKDSQDSFSIIAEHHIKSIITHSHDKYQALFTGDSPVIKSGILSTSIDYKALEVLIKDPEQSLSNSMSEDTYAVVERLYLIHSIKEETLKSRDSEFKNDLEMSKQALFKPLSDTLENETLYLIGEHLGNADPM
jgi:hypothetical protein